MDPDSLQSQQTESLRGFIVTRQWVELTRGTELIFWVATESGPLRFRISGQESVFFVSASHADKAEKSLGRFSGWRSAPTELKNFQHQPVVAFYFRNQRQLYGAKDTLTSNGVTVFEADINPTDRFLMERFITGGIEIAGEFIDEKGFVDVHNPVLRPADFKPELRCVSVDIETAYTGNELFSIGVFTNSISLVFMVGLESEIRQGSEFMQLYKDEAAVIEAFLDWVRQYDPDIIIGWNVVNFDLQFLQRCCDRLRIEFNLGRNKEPVKWRKSRDRNDRFFALVPGRVVLDGIELMRSATYHFENFSLDHVAHELLNRGKLVDDVDQRGEEISRQFREDKNALAKYNLEDCRLVWDIFEQEQLIAFALERSHLTGLELNRYGGSVAAFDFLYLPKLHRAGYIAPSLDQVSSDNISPGGYVMNSVPGIFDDVIVLDFKSLYPSIIRTFNIDPLALIIGETEQDPIPGFDGGVFSKNTHILPNLIEKLWQARDRAKASNNAVFSQAIKIIMNSFYGVLGTTGCRFFDSRLVSSITRRGHQIIIDSKEFLEQQGYQVIYGDTDSVFVHIKNNTTISVEETGNKLANQLTHWWTTRLKEEMQIESCLELEFETHFQKFLMPTVRGADTGSKKRYAGLVRNSDNPEDFRLVFKGLETVRSDWSPLARQFQQQLYRRIFLDEPYEEFVKQTVADVLAGHEPDDLILRRRLRRKLNDYVKNVPPHVQAARKAEAVRKEKGLPQMFDQGGWVEYVMTVNGPEPRQYRSAPIDVDFYVERQIAPIADSILVFKGTSMKELLDKQMGLF